MSGTSATETRNLAVIRRGYEAFAAGDVETLKTLFLANAKWHVAPAGVLQGNYQGVQAILEYFGQLAHETDLMPPLISVERCTEKKNRETGSGFPKRLEIASQAFE